MTTKSPQPLLANPRAESKLRVALDEIGDLILAEQYHQFAGTTDTVCCLTLRNGFTVIGRSATANPEEFDAEIGRVMARLDATREISKLLAFAKVEAGAMRPLINRQ